jgi:predicted metal-dependent hydrolase
VRAAKLSIQRETISLGGRLIPLVVRRNLQARRVVLRIDIEAGGISLTLPSRTPLAEGLALAHERADWVIRCLDKLPARIPFADGATLPLLGNDTTIRHAPQTRLGVLRIGGELIVSGAREHLPRRVGDWLKREAKREIGLRAGPMAERIERSIAALTVRDTRSRWGSCTPDGKLSFCWRLILTPEWVLDYVVAHEVAHLAHLNHGPKFWATVKSLGVNPEQARAWLNVHAERLQRIG